MCKIAFPRVHDGKSFKETAVIYLLTSLRPLIFKETAEHRKIQSLSRGLSIDPLDTSPISDYTIYRYASPISDLFQKLDL